jgi:putative transposase
MNPNRCDALDYIHFLVAAQKSFSCTEAARCQPDPKSGPAHDAFTRLLRRQPPDTEALWQETRGLVQLEAGVLVLDDTTLDKPYARKMELVTAIGVASIVGWC